MLFRSGAVSLTAIDPGGTTGWAGFDAQYTEGTFHEKKFHRGQLGPEEHHESLLGLLERRRTHNSIVICEAFDNRDNPAARLISCEYIGVVKLFHQQSNAPVVFQGSQVCNGDNHFWSTEKLRRLDLSSPAMVHAQDAMKHLLHYMYFSMQCTWLVEALRS
jgi:hypothetical protein